MLEAAAFGWRIPNSGSLGETCLRCVIQLNWVPPAVPTTYYSKSSKKNPRTFLQSSFPKFWLQDSGALWRRRRRRRRRRNALFGTRGEEMKFCAFCGIPRNCSAPSWRRECGTRFVCTRGSLAKGPFISRRATTHFRTTRSHHHKKGLSQYVDTAFIPTLPM